MHEPSLHVLDDPSCHSALLLALLRLHPGGTQLQLPTVTLVLLESMESPAAVAASLTAAKHSL